MNEISSARAIVGSQRCAGEECAARLEVRPEVLWAPFGTPLHEFGALRSAMGGVAFEAIEKFLELLRCNLGRCVSQHTRRVEPGKRCKQDARIAPPSLPDHLAVAHDAFARAFEGEFECLVDQSLAREQQRRIPSNGKGPPCRASSEFVSSFAGHPDGQRGLLDPPALRQRLAKSALSLRRPAVMARGRSGGCGGEI